VSQVFPNPAFVVEDGKFPSDHKSPSPGSPSEVVLKAQIPFAECRLCSMLDFLAQGILSNKNLFSGSLISDHAPSLAFIISALRVQCKPDLDSDSMMLMQSSAQWQMQGRREDAAIVSEIYCPCKRFRCLTQEATI
jgi:hypothetical protein